MKLFLTLCLTIIVLFVSAQQKSPDYSQRTKDFIVAGNVAAVASALCWSGVVFTDLPQLDKAKAADADYVKKFDADYNSSVQTQKELVFIGTVTGVAALTCYTFSYINYKKGKKNGAFSYMLMPNNFIVSYKF